MAIDYSKAKYKNTIFGGTDSIIVPVGGSGDRSGTELGQVRYNSDLGFLEQYNAAGWAGIDAPPVVTNQTGVINEDTDTNITVDGSNFKSGSVVYITGAGVSNSERALSTSFVSSSQLTASTNASSVNFIGGASYGVKVVNPSGLSAVLDPAGNIDRDPAWVTSSGTIATWGDKGGAQSATVNATDADGDTVTYSLVSGSLPGNSNLNTSNGTISTSDPTDVGSSTTYTFTLAATAASQTVNRTFNIIVNPTPDGSSSARAVANANDLLDIGQTSSGAYWIDLPNQGPTQVYCDQTTDGGGWMMLAYAGSTSGVGNSNHIMFHQFGSVASTRSYGQTSFSRFDEARAMTGAGTSSRAMWRRTNDSNVIIIHTMDEMWNRIPGGSSAGNMNMSGSGSGYPITTMRLADSGPNNIVAKSNGRYETGPNYPGIAWNSSYADNRDGVGSFSTFLNRRSMVYWETNGPQAQSQWFHADVLEMNPSDSPTESQNKKDVEVYFRVSNP